MHVVRDLVDKRVVDRNDRDMGRVDDIVINIEPGSPPVLASILIGASALGARLHPRIGRWAAAIERWLGVAAERPVSINAREIDQIDRVVKVRLSIGETSAGAVEGRMRAWLLRIPGSG